jgi:hypothetical protein
MVLANLDGLYDRVKEAFDTTQAGATERAWFNGRINALRLAEGRISEEDNGEQQVAQNLVALTLGGLSPNELKQAVENARWSADNLDENTLGFWVAFHTLSCLLQVLGTLEYPRHKMLLLKLNKTAATPLVRTPANGRVRR